MLKTRRVILWVGLFTLVLLVFHYLNRKHALLNRPEMQGRVGVPVSSPSPSATHPRVLQSPSPRSSLERSQDLWDRFQKKYGNQLSAEFSAEHFLTSIQGKLRPHPNPSSEFNPNNEYQVRDRAKKILHELSGLIGERPDWPMQLSEVRVGPRSGQAYFRETYQGLWVKPRGGVKIDLGSSGEILGIYSDYVPTVDAVFPALISESNAREKAREIFSRQQTSPLDLNALRPGEKIVWVTGRVGSTAYEFICLGRELVLDGRDGRILIFRDRRHY